MRLLFTLGLCAVATQAYRSNQNDPKPSIPEKVFAHPKKLCGFITLDNPSEISINDPKFDHDVFSLEFPNGIVTGYFNSTLTGKNILYHVKECIKFTLEGHSCSGSPANIANRLTVASKNFYFDCTAKLVLNSIPIISKTVAPKAFSKSPFNISSIDLFPYDWEFSVIRPSVFVYANSKAYMKITLVDHNRESALDAAFYCLVAGLESCEDSKFYLELNDPVFTKCEIQVKVLSRGKTLTEKPVYLPISENRDEIKEIPSNINGTDFLLEIDANEGNSAENETIENASETTEDTAETSDSDLEDFMSFLGVTDIEDQVNPHAQKSEKKAPPTIKPVNDAKPPAKAPVKKPKKDFVDLPGDSSDPYKGLDYGDNLYVKKPKFDPKVPLRPFKMPPMPGNGAQKFSSLPYHLFTFRKAQDILNYKFGRPRTTGQRVTAQLQVIAAAYKSKEWLEEYTREEDLRLLKLYKAMVEWDNLTQPQQIAEGKAFDSSANTFKSKWLEYHKYLKAVADRRKKFDLDDREIEEKNPLVLTADDFLPYHVYASYNLRHLLQSQTENSLVEFQTRTRDAIQFEIRRISSRAGLILGKAANFWANSTTNFREQILYDFQADADDFRSAWDEWWKKDFEKGVLPYPSSSHSNIRGSLLHHIFTLKPILKAFDMKKLVPSNFVEGGSLTALNHVIEKYLLPPSPEEWKVLKLIPELSRLWNLMSTEDRIQKIEEFTSDFEFKEKWKRHHLYVPEFAVSVFQDEDHNSLPYHLYTFPEMKKLMLSYSIASLKRRSMDILAKRDKSLVIDSTALISGDNVMLDKISAFCEENRMGSQLTRIRELKFVLEIWRKMNTGERSKEMTEFASAKNFMKWWDNHNSIFGWFARKQNVKEPKNSTKDTEKDAEKDIDKDTGADTDKEQEPQSQLSADSLLDSEMNLPMCLSIFLSQPGSQMNVLSNFIGTYQDFILKGHPIVLKKLSDNITLLFFDGKSDQAFIDLCEAWEKLSDSERKDLWSKYLP